MGVPWPRCPVFFTVSACDASASHAIEQKKIYEIQQRRFRLNWRLWSGPGGRTRPVRPARAQTNFEEDGYVPELVGSPADAGPPDFTIVD